MSNRETGLIISYLESLDRKIDQQSESIDKLGDSFKAHAVQDTESFNKLEKRISKLEWLAAGVGALFGVIGSLLSSKIYAIFGIQK